MNASATLMMLGLTGLVGMAYADTQSSGNALLPVTVGVYARHAGGKIAYHYRVYNRSQQDIVAVTIGRDNLDDANPDNDVNELSSLPSGWNAKLGIPTTSVSTPTGWRASVVDPEDNPMHAITWERLNERSPVIRTRQTVSRMSVSLDNADNSYMDGHALITFDDGNPATVTVPIDRLDLTPPSLTVILIPDTIAPENGKYVAVKASFIVKDDYDRLPEIKLESITANEPLDTDDVRDASIGLDDRYFKFLAKSSGPRGRIYTVTYSATDASGNQVIASADVTVAAPTESMPNFAPND